MAFFNKAGNILRQIVSNKLISKEVSASSPSIFQMLRCMSTAKVFIGGLSYSTDDVSLRESFAKYGEVIEARVIVDRETGRSRGFGFVTYTTPEEASSAIQALDGQDLHGRMVRVNYANERARSPGFGGGGGGYGGGGYGGGGYGDGSGGYRGGGGGGGFGSYGGGSSSYGSGGDGGSDSYGSGGGNYGGGYGTGGSVGYGNDTQNSGDAGGGSGFGGGSGYGSGGGGYGGGSYGTEGVPGGVGGSGVNDFAASSGNDAKNTSFGYGGGSQFGSGDGTNAGAASEGYSQTGPLEETFRNDDDQPDDYANRRA